MRLVSRAQFAKICGVTRAAISQACQNGTLKSATVGRRIDLDSPAAVDYAVPHHGAVRRADEDSTRSLNGEGLSVSAPTKAGRGRPPRATIPSGSKMEIDEIARSLAPIVARWGTATAFKDWLRATKDVEIIRGRQLENDESEGRLISRDFVRMHVMSLVDACFRRLLQDAPKTMARRIYAAAKSGESVEVAERVIADTVGSHLEQLKAGASRAIRNA